MLGCTWDGVSKYLPGVSLPSLPSWTLKDFAVGACVGSLALNESLLAAAAFSPWGSSHLSVGFLLLGCVAIFAAAFKSNWLLTAGPLHKQLKSMRLKRPGSVVKVILFTLSVMAGLAYGGLQLYRIPKELGPFLGFSGVCPLWPLIPKFLMVGVSLFALIAMTALFLEWIQKELPSVFRTARAESSQRSVGQWVMSGLFTLVAFVGMVTTFGEFAADGAALWQVFPLLSCFGSGAHNFGLLVAIVVVVANFLLGVAMSLDKSYSTGECFSAFWGSTNQRARTLTADHSGDKNRLRQYRFAVGCVLLNGIAMGMLFAPSGAIALVQCLSYVGLAVLPTNGWVMALVLLVNALCSIIPNTLSAYLHYFPKGPNADDGANGFQPPLLGQ